MGRSRWYRLRVHVGQKIVKRCEFGGFTGGETHFLRIELCWSVPLGDTLDL